MNTGLMKNLEKYLNQYSIDLEFWYGDIMETHETVAVRRFLGDNMPAMTSDMRDRLAALDEQAKSILNGYHGEETWDVKMLRQVVALANNNQRQAA